MSFFNYQISLENLVIKKTQLAKECGIDGAVSSGMEAKIIRENLGKDFTIITPGIRSENIEGDDQKRTVDVKTAFQNGANYIVVGRPINAAINPLLAAKKFQEQISKQSL